MTDHCPDCGGLLIDTRMGRKDCTKCYRVWIKFYDEGWYAVGMYDTYLVNKNQWAKYQKDYENGVKKVL